MLGDADAGQLWRRAVVTRGAIGVISTALPAYLNADPPGAEPTPRDEWDILQWGSVPYDEARKGFGFKASPRAAATLRQALRAGRRADAGESFASRSRARSPTKPTRTLVAEIPGTHRARRAHRHRRARAGAGRERQRERRRRRSPRWPSRCRPAIRAEEFRRPARTITFLFLERNQRQPAVASGPSPTTRSR